ncbi:MAG: hypothetical protein ACR2LL_08730 [Nitrosopumilus sp.]
MSQKTKQMDLSTDEINTVWSNFHEALNELQVFESKNDVTKKQIISRIRDNVVILVDAEKIPIKMNQVKVYVENILDERGITISKAWSSELFEPHQKRNYSKSSEPNIHEHQWDLIAENPQLGKWESCHCGANRLNGILQQDVEIPSLDETKPTPIAEVIEPKGTEFEILKGERAVAQNLVTLIDMIIQKCTINKTVIQKSLKDKPQYRIDERMQEATKLSEKRIQTVQEEVKKLGKPEEQLKQIKSLIADQLSAKKKLNDRKKITRFEKVMVKLAISLGYSKNYVAGILNITPKHIKNDILASENPSSHGQNTLLEEFEWFGRCPNPDCGIILKDYYDEQIDNYRQGKSIEEPFDLEPLLATGYASQVVQLSQQLKKVKEKLPKSN